MRPILWGTIWFVIGGAGWVGFSAMVGLGEGVTSEPAPSVLKTLVYIFGLIFFFSLPIAIIAEIIRWIKKERKKKKK